MRSGWSSSALLACSLVAARHGAAGSAFHPQNRRPGTRQNRCDKHPRQPARPFAHHRQTADFALQVGAGGCVGPARIEIAENIDASGTRSMDHTTSIIVVDPQGRGVAALPGGQTPQAMAEQLRALRGFLGEP